MKKACNLVMLSLFFVMVIALQTACADTENQASKKNVNDEALQELAKQMNSENIEEQNEAIIELLSIDERSIPIFASALKSKNRRLRNCMVNLLSDLGPPAISSIAKILKESEEEEVKIAVAYILGEIKDKTAIPLLLDLLKKSDSNMIKNQAMISLGNNNAVEAAAEISKFLEDAEPGIRSRAAVTLGELKLKEYIPRIVDAIKTEKNNDVKSTFIATLRMYQSPDVIPLLKGYLEKEEFAGCKQEAILGLGSLCHEDEAAVKIIKNFLNDEDKTIKFNAMWALGNMKAKSAINDLLKLIPKYYNDTVSFVNIIRAISAIGDESVIPEITGLSLRLIAEKDKTLRSYYAVKALNMLSFKEKYMKETIKQASDSDNKIRGHALWALGESNSKEVIPALIKALEDENADNRVLAVVGLGRAGTRREQLSLTKMLDDKDGSVRAEAKYALNSITHYDFGTDKKLWERFLTALDNYVRVMNRNYKAQSEGKQKK